MILLTELGRIAFQFAFWATITALALWTLWWLLFGEYPDTEDETRY